MQKAQFYGLLLVLPHRIELWTSPLPRGCSTTELRQRRRERISDHAGDVERPACRPRFGLLSISVMTGGSGKSGDPRRVERLKAALRDNLKRRKAQVKARAQAAIKAAEHDSAGITPEIAPHKPKG